MAGVTPEGFEIKTQQQIIADLQEAERDGIDPQIEYADEDPLGQLNGILSAPLAELWELAQELYYIIDRENAEDDALENVGALSGVPKGDASKSVAYLTLDIDLGEVVSAGAIVAVDGQEEIRFLLVEEQTGEASPLENVRFESENTGPVQAAAGSLTVIVTPFTGWNSATNPADASPGHDVQTNAQYRRSIVEGTARGGGSGVDHVQAQLLQLNDEIPGSPILDVAVFENTSLVTDANGLPGKSIEALVNDGEMVEDTVIGQAIWDSKTGGARTYGTIETTAIDVNGKTHAVFFSRPEEVPITQEFEIEIDPATYVGDAAFKAKIVELSEVRYKQGRDVVAAYQRSFALQSIGVENVLSFGMHRDADPDVDTRIEILIREIATFDTSDITVTTSIYVEA
jgi:uncharacterized phage protein gp47/JayE